MSDIDANSASENKPDKIVEDDVIASGDLPSLRYRDMPKPVSWKKMIGPSIMLAGLSLGSGEFVLWPLITYRLGFLFFWACILGVTTQYFLNLEIERWTLATGESAITGFCRISKHFAILFLLFNFVPWVWPAWVTGASTLVNGIFFAESISDDEVFEVSVSQLNAASVSKLPDKLIYDVESQSIRWTGDMLPEDWEEISSVTKEIQVTADKGEEVTLLAVLSDQLLGQVQSKKKALRSEYTPYIGVIGLILIGLVLTSGPVVYNTVEKIQIILVSLIFILSILIGIFVINGTAVKALLASFGSIGAIPDTAADPYLNVMKLLGAIAFAGAGGTLNLGQSNYIKDKGYGMGAYIGRITSPITGQQESVSEVGYHFEHTEENLSRWKEWWRAANLEHFFSFFLTCLVSLVLLSLITFSLLRDNEGKIKAGMEVYGDGMGFIFGQADVIGSSEQFGALGPFLKYSFLVMGVIILMTTALGILDGISRIFADLLKVNYFAENKNWSLSRLYFASLWGMIGIGSSFMIIGLFYDKFKDAMFLFQNTSAMNGGVMAVYSALLLYLNFKVLPKAIRMSWLRLIVMTWSTLFFGAFTVLAIRDLLD